MKFSFHWILIMLLGILIPLFSGAKSGDVQIKYGKTKIGVNQVFTITISIENEYLKKYSDFPEIKGLRKMGTSSSTNTSIVNGKMTVVSSITQNYYPTKEGKFKLRDFAMEVNGKNYKVSGTTIEIGPPVQRKRRPDPFAWDPFEEMTNPEDLEYVDVEADAFLAVTTDKKEVYRGEGFNATISFFVAESNRAQMRWPGNLSDQISEAIKSIKPGSVWEENFNIQEIQKKKVKIRGKVYDQYILYQSTFFPLIEEDIDIPSISLTLVKYKEATTRSFFGRPRIEDNEKFRSAPKKVRVKPLPFHPLKESVSVGIFQLDEKISPGPYKTGESFLFDFSIKGIGNISGVQPPETPQDEYFDFFSPEIVQNINRNNNTISGSKKFSYYTVPKEPGNFELGPYFTWVYFDPKRESYDTLVSDIAFRVEGSSRKNTRIKSSDLGDFYDRIEIADNNLVALNSGSFPMLLIQILTGVVMLVSLIFFFRNNVKYFRKDHTTDQLWRIPWPAIGGILDGLPSNMPVNIEEIQQELDRRKPGTSKITSQRKEPDKLEILSGVMEGKSLGTPLGFIIRTADRKSQDYDHLKEVFRPSHADYTWEKKYGIRDHRGGGRSSARETANWVVGGSLVRPILEREGIQISSYVSGIGSIDLPQNYGFYSEEEVYASDTRCPERAMAKRMEELVEEAKENNDSLGGRISCVIKNVPPGLGEPVFDKITSRLGASLLSLNAVKGVEFGAGFLGTTLRGSESNDEIGMDGDKVLFKSNNSGGTLGGLSSGADICFRIAFKPTATIGKKQRTIDKKGNATDLEARGRHDPCVVPRAVPIVKALASLVISDFIMIDKLSRFSE